MKVTRLKAYPNINYKEYMVVSFKVDHNGNGDFFYWSGLFEGGNEESAFQKGEEHIILAKKPKYKWGKERNWYIFTSENEILPHEIYKSKSPVLHLNP